MERAEHVAEAARQQAAEPGAVGAPRELRHRPRVAVVYRSGRDVQVAWPAAHMPSGAPSAAGHGDRALHRWQQARFHQHGCSTEESLCTGRMQHQAPAVTGLQHIRMHTANAQLPRLACSESEGLSAMLACCTIWQLQRLPIHLRMAINMAPLL